jgi:hypothetical protein
MYLIKSRLLLPRSLTIHLIVTLHLIFTLHPIVISTMMLDIVLAISLLSSALTVPQPLPTPVDILPTLTLADFGKSSLLKSSSRVYSRSAKPQPNPPRKSRPPKPLSRKTILLAQERSPGSSTRQSPRRASTVAQSKSQSSTQNPLPAIQSPRGLTDRPALVTGKLAGIIIGVVIGVIILLVLAIFLYKRRQKKRALLNSGFPKAGAEAEAEEGHGGKVDPKEVVSLPVVQGEMGYKEEPANPAPVPAARSNPVDAQAGTIQGLPPTSLSRM